LAAAFSTDAAPIFVYDGAAPQKKEAGNMRRVAIAAVMIALLPVSAYPQENAGPPTARTDREKKDDAAIDKAYQDAVKRTGNKGQAAKSDPWQTVRPAGADSTKR
jgi:hypothetical protein